MKDGFLFLHTFGISSRPSFKGSVSNFWPLLSADCRHIGALWSQIRLQITKQPHVWTHFFFLFRLDCAAEEMTFGGS